MSGKMAPPTTPVMKAPDATVVYRPRPFTANVNMSGTFDRGSLRALGDTVVLELGVITKQIVKLNPLKICEQEILWHKSDYYLFAKVKLDELPETIEF